MGSYLGTEDIGNSTLYNIRPSDLLDALDQHTEIDMGRYASESAVDYMQAYYKVRFVYNEELGGD